MRPPVPPAAATARPPDAAAAVTRAELEALTLEHLPRLARLRQAILAARPAMGVQRAFLLTRFHQEHGFDEARPVLHEAQALAFMLDRLPTPVFPDELLVGSTTEHRLGALVFPELMGMAIWPELPTITRRAADPVALGEEDAERLADEVLPFWRAHTVHEWARRTGGEPESLRVAERMVLYLLARSNGVSHVIPDYHEVLRDGLRRLIARTAERERQAADPEARELLAAIQVALSAVLRFAARYAAACRTEARRATGARAQELATLAVLLERVPAEPARSLHEALQAVWLVHVALHQENSDLALSFGRLDQLLAPALAADRARGLTLARAAELVGAFFVKLNDHTPLVPATGRELVGGAPTGQAVTIGGRLADGADGVNELTHVMLRTAEILGLREPNLCARLHAGSDPGYRRALVDTIARSGAIPALYGDEAVVEALAAHGVAPEHAWDYGLVGCVEPTAAGRTMGMTGAILFNLAAVLELALHDGIHPLSGVRIGPATGGLTTCGSFAAFRAAFDRQLAALVGLACDGNRRLLEAHAALRPSPLLSALIDGAAERGRDVTRGGARYNSSGVAVVGLADVADSLTALEQLVFGSGRVGLAELDRALRADFVGHAPVRALLASKAPKYGNDDAAADAQAVRLVEQVARAFAAQDHPHGGRYHVGYWTMTLHTGFGALTGALPSGRRRGAPLASGATPVAGAARNGPTAALASTAKLPARLVANGLANNHKLPRRLLAQPAKRELFARLVEVYFARGGMQLQLTVQDRATLLAAQRDPEAHRDLLVRVSGYSAYFCDLTRGLQDEILARTEDVV